MVAHIHAQVGLVADLEQVAAGQAKALLQTLINICRLELGVVMRVSQLLQASEVWGRSQLTAFSACLRANADNRLHQPGPRAMQSNPCIEHYFLQEDWDKLQTHKLSPEQIQEIIAIRLFSYGTYGVP